MNEKALKTLEYNKIIDRLTEYASSTGGKALCRALVPYDNLSDIETAQQHTRDAFSRSIRRGQRFLLWHPRCPGLRQTAGDRRHAKCLGASVHLLPAGDRRPHQKLRPQGYRPGYDRQPGSLFFHAGAPDTPVPPRSAAAFSPRRRSVTMPAPS